MNHTNTTDKIQLVTDSTSGLDVAVSYTLQNDGLAQKNDYSKITTATTTDIVLPDDATCNILALNVRNVGVSSNTVTVQKYFSSTTYQVFKAALAPGESLLYNGKWGVYTQDGKMKVQSGSVGGGGDMLVADYDPANISEQLVGLTATQTLTNKRITQRISTEVSSATPTINTDAVDCHSITALATNITSMTTNLSGTPTNFQRLMVRIKDDGNSRSITWGASFEAKGVSLPTITTPNKTLHIGFQYDTVSAKWGCIAAVNEA